MGKAVSRKNACRVLHAPGFWCLALVLGVGLVTAPPAVGLQNLNLRGEAVAGTAVDNSASWDAVDAAIDLTGLWGSIDPVHDVDPFIYTDLVTGDVHLFWAMWNGESHEIVHASRAPGAVWAGPEMVVIAGLGGGENVTPRAIVDTNGFLHVSWTRRGGFTSSIYHSLRVSGGWTSPDLLSNTDFASEPFHWLDGSRIMVDYQTPLELVTVEIHVTISGYSGGSDDIDPTQVTVESETVNRTLVLR